MRILINEIYWILRISFNPSCWIRNGFTNKRWNKMLIEELKNPIFIIVDAFTVNLNGKVIWIENFPYDTCTDYSISHNSKLPSRRTVFKFFDAMEKQK